MNGSGSAVMLGLVVALAPLLALRMHRLRLAGGRARAARWRLAAIASGGALAVGVALLLARVPA